MKPAYLILLLSAGLAAQESVLKADRTAHVLVIKGVYVNGRGPFRMMIDTGAAASLVRPEVAKKLGLRPAYAVEYATAAGVRPVPATLLDEVRIGPVTDQGIEVLITDVNLLGLDGVLGQSWLSRHDYLLDYHNRRVVLNAAAPERGVRAALRSSDGRPEIAAEVDGRRQDLVVDSGASTLILFAPSGTVRQEATIMTQSGSIGARTGSAKVSIGAGYSRKMEMAQVNTPTQPGLLPAAAFGSVYISNREGVVVLVP